MTSVAVLREQIAELEALSNETTESRSFATRMMMRGIEQMHADLTDAVDLALRPQLKVVIDGAPVKGHEIRVDALSRLLYSLQESISSVAQALTGKATERASLPGLIRDTTSLRLAAVFPGSFGATLRGPVDKKVEEMIEAGQDPLFPQEEVVTLLDQAVDAVLDVIDLAAAEGTDDGPIIEAVLPLGGRAFKHLKDLSDAIVDRDMTASLDWNHLGHETRHATVNKESARRLNDVLTMNRVTETTEIIRGHLGTASEFHGGRLEIQRDNGDVISAKVADDLVPRLRDFYSHRVEADAIVTTARSTATGNERKSYIVTGLSTLPEAPQLPDVQ
ncbi:hypothetical protein NODU109028_06280 [Nocardioides dubius]|uniref:hypothetical protein n=1 Tax=Nocardioides dubius TaxID=317019 RepID=UPI0039E85B3A